MVPGRQVVAPASRTSRPCLEDEGGRPGGPGGFLTLPNLLTLSRVPMAALAWWRPLDPVYTLGLMGLAGLTDILDGWVERRRRARRPAGAAARETIGVWLDPLCDKIFILSLLGAVTAARALPGWLIPIIALREILQTLILAATRAFTWVRDRLRPRFRASPLGKLTTVAQFAAIGAMLIGRPDVVPLALVSGGLGLVAVADYVRRARRP